MSTAKRQNIALKISLFPGETMAKSKSDIERDKSKIDPWKVIHFEPVWGIRKDCQMDEVNPADSEYGPLVDEIETTNSHIRSLPKPEVPKTEFEIRNEKRKERRKRLAALAAAEAEAKKSKNSSNKDVKNEENENESDSDENQPLIKKIKSDPNQQDYQKQAVTTSDDKKPKAEIEIEDEKEKVKVEKTEEVIQPDLILEEVQDEIMEDGGVLSEKDGATPTSPKLETVIEEPVSLIEEDDNSISDPPLRSCSVDQEAEVVSIPPSPPPLGVHPAGGSGSVGGVASGGVASGGVTSQAATPSPTPPTLSVTPIPVSAGLPAEFMANMSDAAMNIPSVSSTIVASSPASIRSARGNSITFSSSRYVML